MQNLEKSMISKLIETAMEQLKFSYTPYSNFKVGASLLTKNGEIYTGCNIENAAYTPTNCAERTAIFKAVSEGVREFDTICIVGGKDGILTEYTAPCGVCRQVMMEFCDPETFRIILATDKEQYDIAYNLLIPTNFSSNKWRFTSPFVKFELEDYYLEILSEQKIFRTVNDENISVKDKPKMISGNYPELLRDKGIEGLKN